jgi:hypothetical protein
MEKNWLIRTVEYRILGPASKDKVIELIRKGSLRSDDELCMGNGFWFFVREKELVDRYLFTDEAQHFNPISEAQTVLAKEKVEVTAKIPTKKDALLKIQSIDRTIEAMSKNADGTFMIRFPKEEDLEYPDLNCINTAPPDQTSQTEGTVLLHMNQRNQKPGLEAKKDLGKVKAPKKEKLPIKDDSGIFFPDSSDLEYPEIDQHIEEREKKEKPESEMDDHIEKTEPAIVAQELKVEALRSNQTSAVTNPAKLRGPDTRKVEEYKNKRGHKGKIEVSEKNLGNRSHLLIYIMVLGIIIIGLGFYFYFKNINTEFSLIKNLNPIQNLYAQENDESLSKKKS